MSEVAVMDVDSVALEGSDQRAPEQRSLESRAAYLQRSHAELGRFFDELKELSLTKHFVLPSGKVEEGEYYDYNKYATSHGGSEGTTEFRLVRHEQHYYLDTHTTTKVGETHPASQETNSTEGERFESDPKKLTYTRSEYRPKVSPPHVTLDRIEVSDGLLVKKGTAGEARTAMDNLNARLAALRQMVNPAH